MAEVEHGIVTNPQILLFAPQLPFRHSNGSLSGEYHLITEKIEQTISTRLRRQLSQCEVLLIDVTHRSKEVLREIEQLRSVISNDGGIGRILCFSQIHRNPRLALEIQKRGACFVTLSGPEMLSEAVQAMFAEAKERAELSFQIVHRFSQGTCAPGEEIAAVFLRYGQSRFQLSLGLAQRLVFEYLAAQTDCP